MNCHAQKTRSEDILLSDTLNDAKSGPSLDGSGVITIEVSSGNATRTSLDRATGHDLSIARSKTDRRDQSAA